MRVSIVILFSFFTLLHCVAQEQQPVYVGEVNWLRSSQQPMPQKMQVKVVQRVGTAISYKDEDQLIIKSRIDPGTQLIHAGATRPVVEQLHVTGKKIGPPEEIEAPPLLVRDNTAFNISYSSRQHGFPGNYTTDFLEDDHHQMWIAADNALMRYNGHRYFLYTPKNGVPEMPMLSFLEDEEKRIWLASDKGVFYMQHDSIFSLRSQQTDLSAVAVVKIQSDAQHRIWLSTKQHGVICIEGKQLKIYDNRCGLPFNYAKSVFPDKNGNLFIAGNDYGVVIIKPDQMVSIFRKGKNIHWNTFLSFYEDQDGLWIGGYNAGFMRINSTDTMQYSISGKYDERVFDIKKAPRGGLWLSCYGLGVCYFDKTRTLLFRADNGLLNRYPYFLYEDSYGNIWVSSLSEGFSRINQNTFYVQPYQNPALRDVHSILPDGNKGNWFSMYGNGIAHQAGNRTTVYNYAKDGNTFLSYPEAIVVNKDGTVWMGSYGACMVLAKENVFTSYEYEAFAENRIVKDVKRDGEGRTWFLPVDYGLILYKGKDFYRYTQKDGLLSNRILNIFTDREQRINWTFKEGLQRMNGTSIETLYTGDQQLTRQITGLLAIDDRTSIMGTYDSGLLIIHNNNMYRWNTSCGLGSNNIQTIIQDKHKRIWISTDKGIESFLLNRAIISDHRIYNQADGSYIINAETAFLGADGMPFWGMKDKKIVFNPTFTHSGDAAPVFAISRILIDKEQVANGDKLSVLPNQQIAIDYRTIYWGRENGLKLSYQILSRRDTTERLLNLNGTVLISDLLPGDYTLAWIARDNNRLYRWAPVSITIRNFWYNTWAFRGLVLLLLACAVAFYFRRKSKRQQEMNRLLQAQVNEQTTIIRKEKADLEKSYRVIDDQNKEKDVLIQEINHRVKNNLQFLEAMIQMQINSDQNKDIIQSLRGTSRRLSAMSLVHELLYNDKNIQLVSTHQYINELVINLKELATDEMRPVQFHVKIEERSIDAKSAIALGMIISEAVSNSLKHAFNNTVSPAIWVTLVAASPGTLELRIEDNGSGSKTDHQGLGSRLIDIFSRQLAGSYTIDYSTRFLYILHFNPNTNT